MIADHETCTKLSANGVLAPYPGASFHKALQVSLISLDGMILCYISLQWGKMVLRLSKKKKRAKHKKPPNKSVPLLLLSKLLLFMIFPGNIWSPSDWFHCEVPCRSTSWGIHNCSCFSSVCVATENSPKCFN